MIIACMHTCSCYNEKTLVRIAGNGDEANRNNSFPLKASFAQPSGITTDEGIPTCSII